MNTHDYIVKKYSDIIDQHLADEDYAEASDAVDRLAEFYCACQIEPSEKEDWQK